VALKSVNGTGLLVATEPHADSEMGTASLGTTVSKGLNFARKMGEILGNLASGTSDGHFSRLDLELNCTRKLRLWKFDHLPPEGILRKSSVNSTLILLISSLLNNNAIERELGNVQRRHSH